jgi:antitoxin component HigA of HigAB toxin-antitoxin module
MEQQGLAAKDLEPFIGSSGRITALIVRLYADREPPLE